MVLAAAAGAAGLGAAGVADTATIAYTSLDASSSHVWVMRGNGSEKDQLTTGSVVDVAPVKELARPVTLAEIKADARFKTFALVRISRLSVMPVTDVEWKRIEAMARTLPVFTRV